MTQAQFKMLITSMTFTLLINAGVTYWINKHTTEMFLKQCEDKLYLHIKG